jgi:hypothetical protein
MLSKSMKTAIFSRVSAKTFCLPFDTAASNRGPALSDHRPYYGPNLSLLLTAS